ncbi:hypothetical protein OpiT1DRAFT_03804 [Opitutaceae bacterium TAV1]|nr:hypothetical protein OpiT1DRAFT_03804 [Opitutaceae bacterium TAV1]
MAAARPVFAPPHTSAMTGLRTSTTIRPCALPCATGPSALRQRRGQTGPMTAFRYSFLAENAGQERSPVCPLHCFHRPGIYASRSAKINANDTFLLRHNSLAGRYGFFRLENSSCLHFRGAIARRLLFPGPSGDALRAGFRSMLPGGWLGGGVRDRRTSQAGRRGPASRRIPALATAGRGRSALRCSAPDGSAYQGQTKALPLCGRRRNSNNATLRNHSRENTLSC